MEKKLMMYLSNFDLLDLIGIANIVGAEEKEELEDFVIEIVQKFSLLPRKERRELLRLAKDIDQWNRNCEYQSTNQQNRDKFNCDQKYCKNKGEVEPRSEEVELQ